MSISNSSASDLLDVPSTTFFPIGIPKYDSPFEGNSSALQILKQDFCSINGTFPTGSVAHPTNTGFQLFHVGEHNHVGGGIATATCFYCKIGKIVTTEIKQQVQFAGVRQRKVPFQETYEEVVRTSKTVNNIVNGVLFSFPIVTQKLEEKNRTLEAYEVIAREPFTEEVKCDKRTVFFNKRTGSIPDAYIVEKVIFKDAPKDLWSKTIQETYDKKKHPDSKEFVMPATPNGFTEQLPTHYVSETSTPNYNWYTSNIGQNTMIVEPSVIEPYYAGSLVKIEWIVTKWL